MKKILILSFFILSFSFAKAQWVTIPDANFVAWLQFNLPSCMSGNQMDTTCNGIVNTQMVDCSYENIFDLDGIQYFDNLQILDCSGDSLTSIQNLPPNLIELQCCCNQITYIASLPISLQIFNCSFNQLTTIPVLPISVTDFWCTQNPLTTLPILPNNLTRLFWGYIPLNTLPVLPNSLQDLYCENSGLTVLPTLPLTLEKLYCRNNFLTTLPVLPNTLQILECGFNQINTLPPLPASLNYFRCQNNILTNLPSLPNSYLVVDCSYNQLNSLPAFPSALYSINCNHNNLTSLPALNSGLYSIGCGNNLLSSLPVLPANLHVLYCDNNSITSLPALNNFLENLSCDSNLISSLPVFNDSLRVVSCISNSISSLPTFPSHFQNIICSYNYLTSMPPFPESMYLVNCSNNQIQSLTSLPTDLTYLILSNNPALSCLPPIQKINNIQSTAFDISGTNILCLPNQILHNGGFWPALDTLSVCDLFNTNGCDIAWNIQGSVFLDSNNDCIRQSGEGSIAPINVKLLNSGNVVQQFISTNGNYSFNTDFSDYDVIVSASGMPLNLNCPLLGDTLIHVTSIDSLHYNVDFSLGCDTGFDVAATYIGRFPNFFPADTTTVFINISDVALQLYTNNSFSCDSANVGGQVKISFNGPVNFLYSLGLNPVVIGDTLLYTIPNFSTINPNTAYVFTVLTDSTAQIGDQVCFTVNVIPAISDNNISNNTLTHCFAVTNSYDPNEKEVSPVGDIIFPYNDWLTYTIHFQNTGTAAAQHVQIMDTLDTDLDESTFQLLSSSHDPMVQLFGNKVRFNFVAINLPDSTTDLEGSKGYVSYRIKPLPNLPIGTNIENTASIYFDFNAPVVTNTTHTSFINGINSISNNSIPFSLYPNPTSENITVEYSINTSGTLTICNLLSQQVQQISLEKNTSTKNISLTNIPSGIYFCVIKTEDGKMVQQKLVVQK